MRDIARDEVDEIDEIDEIEIRGRALTPGFARCLSAVRHDGRALLCCGALDEVSMTMTSARRFAAPLLLLTLLLGPSMAAEATPAAATSSDAPRADAPSPRLAKRGKPKKKPPTSAPRDPAPSTTDPAPVDPEDSAPAPSAPSGGDDVGGGLEGRRSGPSRIEFDDRLIQGQTNKANAIYLFERRASELRTLVRTRKDFHKEIDESVR